MTTQLKQQPVVNKANVAPGQEIEPSSESYPTTFLINNGGEADHEVYSYTPIRFSLEGYVYSPIGSRQMK